MKKRMFKIWGIGLTVMLVAALFGFAVPVSAAIGNMEFRLQSLPSSTGDVLANNSDVTDFAIGHDGTTIYAVDSQTASSGTGVANGAVYRSTNGGQSWTKLTSWNTVTQAYTDNATPVAVAIAPDDVNAIAVATQSRVYVSNNAGSTWTTLGEFENYVAAQDCQDVAVGPARSNTLLNREYAIALADATAADVTRGDVQIIGGSSASWATVASVYGTRDYMAVAFTPNFVGDRVLVAIGATVAATGTVDRQLLKTSTPNQILSTVAFVTATDNTTNDFGTTTTGIIAADIAMPADFDPMTTSGKRMYVTVATSVDAATDDVFRIQASTFRSLDAVTSEGLKSVAFSGTVDEGTLWVGQQGGRDVHKTTNPTVAMPTWTTVKKSGPTGATATIVRVAGDYASTNRVFAGTTGAESAFSISDNGAVSFNGESLIDSEVGDNVTAVQDIAVTSDGSTVFVATDDGTDLSLWKSAVPVSSSSWSRVYQVAGTTGMLALNRDWAEAPVIYFADLAAGGNIYRSSNGGDTFATRLAPSSYTITAMAVEDASTLHLGDANAATRKSTTGGWTFATAKSSKTGAILSMDAPMTDYLLVGGTDAISYSSDGGSTYTKVTASGANYLILADEDFADNKTIYAGSTTGDLYRFIIGADAALVDLGNPTDVQIVGLAQNNGTLYVPSAAAVDRATGPRAAAGTVIWKTMDVTAGTDISGIAAFAAVNNVVYVARTTTDLPAVWAYDDYLSETKPVITGPGDGATVSVNPVTGYAELVTLSWEAMGTGPGLVTHYRIKIWDKAKGDAAATSSAAAGTEVDDKAEPKLTMGPTGSGADFEFTMLPNTEYEWKVYARDTVSEDYVTSGPSASRTLKVQAGSRVQQPHAGPIMLGPQGGATDASLTPGFSWAPVSGATEYEFILATDAGLTKTVAKSSVSAPAFQADKALAYSTVYFWAVKATKPTLSPQSIGTFTTMAKPAAPPPKPAPPVTVKEVPAPIINIPPAPAPAPAPEMIAPGYILAVIIIGAVLFIAVIVLIVRTRRPM